MVLDAWIPEAPPNAMSLAGYMRIVNHSDQVRTLVQATGEAFEFIEIHRTILDANSGLARMVHEEKINIEPNGTVSFEPGGYHLMLMRPTKALKAGDNVPLTLMFTDGFVQKVEFQVRRERLKF